MPRSQRLRLDLNGRWCLSCYRRSSAVGIVGSPSFSGSLLHDSPSAAIPPHTDATLRLPGETRALTEVGPRSTPLRPHSHPSCTPPSPSCGKSPGRSECSGSTSPPLRTPLHCRRRGRSPSVFPEPLRPDADARAALDPDRVTRADLRGLTLAINRPTSTRSAPEAVLPTRSRIPSPPSRSHTCFLGQSPALLPTQPAAR